VLAGEIGREIGRPVQPPAPAILSPTERRRASLVVRLALAVAGEAAAMSAIPPQDLRAVFGSSNGDGAVLHAILESLTRGDGQVSPTQFHNSVHNAAAGYWTIGTGSRLPATCIGCHDFTAGTALLAAAVEVEAERAPVLLCVYDAPMPPPLDQVRSTAEAFAAALVLAPPGRGMASLRLGLVPGDAQGDAPGDGPGDGPGDAPRDAPRDASAAPGCNPAALLLPLLQRLAGAGYGAVRLPLLDAALEITVEPCSPAPRSPP
jgi:hypothetical protein